MRPTCRSIFSLSESGRCTAPYLRRQRHRKFVRITSTDPRQPPAIRCNYLTEEIDRRTLVEGLKFIRRLFATSPMKDFVVEEIRPGATIRSDADLLTFARANGDAACHLCGSCRMGCNQLPWRWSMRG